MSRFNRFGAVFTDVSAMFPGTATVDYDGGGANGQLRIESALDRAVLEITSALTPDVYKAITQVVNQFVVRYATLGQTTWTLGMIPIIAGTLHLFRYPVDPPLGGIGNLVGASGFFVGDQYYKQPTKGFFEISPSDYSVNAATGVVTYSGAQTVQAGDRIYATYDVDTDNASFALPQLALVVILGAAAEMGERLYSQNTQEWGLVTQYRSRFSGNDETSGLLGLIRAGTLIPDEVRKLNYWQDIERTNNEARSVRLNRG